MMNAPLSRAAFLIDVAVSARSSERPPFLVAIDGRCASGKTTLAAALDAHYGHLRCMTVHMDDFFLRPSQRTPERLATPGGNIDHERFAEEILRPLAAGKDIWYVPYSCREGRLVEPVLIRPTPIVLIEGSYACHPMLRDFYDLRFFLSVDPATQMSRIRARNGEAAAEVFRTRWIPMEEAYIAAYHPEKISICLN